MNNFVLVLLSRQMICAPAHPNKLILVSKVLVCPQLPGNCLEKVMNLAASSVLTVEEFLWHFWRECIF